MEIHIPNSAFLGNIDAFINGFKPENANELKITANKKWISVHPVVLSMLASLGLSAGIENIHCEKLEASSKHYLQRMGLFPFLGIDADQEIIEHEAAGRFVPLCQIQDPESLSNFVTELTPLLHLAPEQAEPIRYITSELVRNVLEHAQSEHGAICCAQYHQKSNTVRIGVVDRGLGIFKTMSINHKPQNNLEAIRLALSPGITGTTSKEGGTEFNAGAGLFFSKAIATVNRSFFVVYSGNAMYKLLLRKGSRISLHADPFDDRHSCRDDLPFWQGTAIGIDISLDHSYEFSELLELIRRTYTKAIQERKKARFKQARFI